MARRKPSGSHADSGSSHVRDSGRQRDKASAAKHGEHARVAVAGPDRDETERAATEELVTSDDVVDVRHIHDVMTGQRRVVVLPAELCRRLGISEGTPLRLVEHESHFEVIPMRLVPATEASSHALESLLAGVTPENLHGEFDTGPAVGRESW
jgi:antitoxin component of MazEF toxin-antitoxin module